MRQVQLGEQKWLNDLDHEVLRKTCHCSEVSAERAGLAGGPRGKANPEKHNRNKTQKLKSRGQKQKGEKGRSFDLFFLLQPPRSLNFPLLCAPGAARLLLALNQRSPEVNHSLSLPGRLPAAGPRPPSPACHQALHPTLKRSTPASCF